MISSAFKMLIIKLLEERQYGLLVYHSRSRPLILSRCCSSCVNLQERLTCLTGAWHATAWKNPDGRCKVRVFMASHVLPMSRNLMCSSIRQSRLIILQQLGTGMSFAIQLFRQAWNAQNASGEGATAFQTFISCLVGCMLDCRQEAQHRGGRGEGDMLLSRVCSHLAVQPSPQTLSSMLALPYYGACEAFLCCLRDGGMC